MITNYTTKFDLNLLPTRIVYGHRVKLSLLYYIIINYCIMDRKKKKTALVSIAVCAAAVMHLDEKEAIL